VSRSTRATFAPARHTHEREWARRQGPLPSRSSSCSGSGSERRLLGKMAADKISISFPSNFRPCCCISRNSGKPSKLQLNNTGNMAETIVKAPASYSQPSRKGKKAWRKNVDLTQVQQGLDDVRDEIIQTGGVVAERDSNELFTTDITGDAEIARKQSGQRLLKADEILGKRSAVAGLDGRKRKAPEIVETRSGKKSRNGNFVSHADVQRLKSVANGGGVGRLDVTEGDAAHDPWSEPAKVVEKRFDFLEPVKDKVEPKTLKHAPHSLAAGGKHVPNVRKPNAGKSYNPLVDDYSALLEREGAVAVEAETQRLASEAKAAEDEAIAAREAATVEAKEKDEYATDYDSAWESEWEGFHSEAEPEVFTQKHKGRKTPSERNKFKARKEREAAEKMQMKDKERKRQEATIQQIAKAVSARDKANGAHAMALQRSTMQPYESDADSSDDDVQVQRRRFGKVQIPDAPLELTLPDELEDSLRRLKPEGNLMEERYRNLLVNGKVEARRKVWQRKQRKFDRTEKWSYKDWKLR